MTRSCVGPIPFAFLLALAAEASGSSSTLPHMGEQFEPGMLARRIQAVVATAIHWPIVATRQAPRRGFASLESCEVSY